MFNVLSLGGWVPNHHLECGWNMRIECTQTMALVGSALSGSDKIHVGLGLWRPHIDHTSINAQLLRSSNTTQLHNFSRATSALTRVPFDPKIINNVGRRGVARWWSSCFKQKNLWWGMVYLALSFRKEIYLFSPIFFSQNMENLLERVRDVCGMNWNANAVRVCGKGACAGQHERQHTISCLKLGPFSEVFFLLHIPRWSHVSHTQKPCEVSNEKSTKGDPHHLVPLLASSLKAAWGQLSSLC